MADVHDIKDARSQRTQPLRLINPAEWQGKPVPDREWLVPGICVRGGATLLNGDGGVGKSLLCMQLQTALALGQPWLGLHTPPKATRSLAIYCEDEPDELHRRQMDICRYYGCQPMHLDGLALMMSRVGENNTLMSFSRREGAGQVTNFFRQVESVINDQEIEVVIIDTAADTFGGHEIDREQVRTFVQKLRGWALRTRGAVIITQHPSVSGMQSGAGSSGSTGWNNSVRSRVYLTKPKRVDDDGDDIPTNERFLKFMKSNYGPINPKMRLVWDAGVFKTIDEAGTQASHDEQQLRETLLDAAADYVRQGIKLSPDNNSRTALVNRVRKDKLSAASYPQKLLISLYEALRREGDLVTTTYRNSERKTETYVRPTWLLYPDEEKGNP